MASLELLYEEDPSWRKKAACRESDTDLFFPKGEIRGADIEQIEAAKAICQLCPVQIDYLEFALTTRQGHGIWGGTTEDERRAILKRRAPNTQSEIG